MTDEGLEELPVMQDVDSTDLGVYSPSDDFVYNTTSSLFWAGTGAIAGLIATEALHYLSHVELPLLVRGALDVYATLLGGVTGFVYSSKD